MYSLLILLAFISASLHVRDRSKRQERVGREVRGEIAQIIFNGYEVKDGSTLPFDLRSTISILSADVSPDLRQARVSVSIRDSDEGEVGKRRAFSWLVDNNTSIRHALSQRLKHMKSIPSLTFVQQDVGGAVDVMNIIDKIGKGAKRESLGIYGGNDDELPEGWMLDDEDDEEEDDEEDDDDEADFDFDLE
ncbi:hypothetical protein TrRE_jg3539 [Triparma retinervis]|uniref:Ribosome-binding factor A n=1 Tax=Triparma retinervis TaxID=2557542 RepID=A0A9W7DTQ8_9STRA|nr:hypothetical protein TrRE_jg3539 [Triparma retinervis]